MKDLIFRFSAFSRDWCIERPEDTTSIWCKIEDIFSVDEKLPYWIELWPASFALAEWIHLNYSLIKGAYCLDLGCGLGFTALVGQYLGAKVIGIDYELQALLYARNNAMKNNILSSIWINMDWRKPAIHKHSLSFVWGSDIIYEKCSVPFLIDFFEYVLAKDGVVWISEPNRSIYKNLHNAFCSHGWDSQKVYFQEIKEFYGNDAVVPINVWEIKR